VCACIHACMGVCVGVCVCEISVLYIYIYFYMDIWCNQYHRNGQFYCVKIIYV